MPHYSRSGKQVTRDGQHFADAVDESAAELIVLAMNRRPKLSPRYGAIPPVDQLPTGREDYFRG